MRTLVSALSLFMLAGCPPPHAERSTHYDQDRILQEYVVEYDGELDETTAAATFFFIPPDPLETRQRLALAKPSRVWHNGSRLGYDKWEGDYRRTMEGFVASHDWEWMDRRRTVYRNTVTLTPTAFVGLPESVSVSGPVALEFEPPLGPGESVRIVVAGSSSDLVSIARAEDAGATFAEPDWPWDAVLADHAGSTVDLVLIRTTAGAPGEATSVGGSLEARFRSAPVPVAVSP
jgi:hypothetical protein